jgi:hypothetical protein
MSCGQGDTKQNEEKDTTEASTNTDKQTESKEKSSNSDDSKLVELFQLERPDSLDLLKSVFGEPKMVERIAPTTDPYQSSTWELSDGTIIWFDDYQVSGTSVEAKGIQVIKTPLGISINQSTLDDCKKIIKDIKQSDISGEFEILKFKNDNVWYFLTFDKKSKLLKVIKLATIELDAVS